MSRPRAGTPWRAVRERRADGRASRPSTERRASPLTRIRERAAPFYGLAAALGIGLPLLLGVVTGRLDQGTLAGLGAFLLAFTAPSGPYSARARSLAVSIVVIAAGGALGGLLAGHRWAVVAAVAAIVPAAVSVSWMGPTVVMAVLLTSIRPPPGHPLENLLLMGGGGLWLALLLLIPWPARRLRPLGGSLARAARAIAALLDVTSAELENPPRTDVQWDRRHRQAAAAVRDAATTYRLYQSGEEEERRASQPQQLIDVFYRMLQRIVGLHAQIQTLNSRASATGDAWRSDAGPAIASLADRARLLSTGLTGHDIGGEPDRGHLSGAERREDPIDAAITDQISRSIDRLDSLLRSSRHILDDGLRLGFNARPRPPSRPSVELVRAIESRSPLFRHATRVAVLVTVAMSISAALRLPHGQWLPVTVLLGLRDTYGRTMARVGQRIIGGVAGSAIAAVLLALAPSPPHIVLIMTVFAAAGFALRPVDYLFWAVCGTPVVMMLMDLTHLSDWDAALERIALVAAGGGIAVVGARVLWPRGAAQQVPARTAELLSANAELTRVVASVVDGQTSRSRLADGLAATSAAIDGVADLRERLENEPSRDTALLDRLTTVIRASAHIRDRLVAIVDSVEDSGGDDPVARILDRVADGIERAASGGSAPRLDLTDQIALPGRPATTRHTLGALVDDVNELIGAV